MCSLKHSCVRNITWHLVQVCNCSSWLGCSFNFDVSTEMDRVTRFFLFIHNNILRYFLEYSFLRAFLDTFISVPVHNLILALDILPLLALG